MHSSNIIGIIPARMGSSRFPGKPMKKILGMPMIGHVYNRCKLSNVLDDVWVATCDNIIYQYIEQINGKVMMTSPNHERASERVSEALLSIEKLNDSKIDIIVMIQGDEPMVVPDMIKQSINPIINDNQINVVNLMSEIKSVDEFKDYNEIKVVVDKENFALYFSREPIPSMSKVESNFPKLKQICVISFKRDFLIQYNQMPETMLERVESIDMNRILEYGLQVKMVKTDYVTFSVDTKQDLKKVNELMKIDSFVSSYL